MARSKSCYLLLPCLTSKVLAATFLQAMKDRSEGDKTLERAVLNQL